MNLKFATVLAVVVALLSGWLLVTVANTMPAAENEVEKDISAHASGDVADSDVEATASVEILKPTIASVEVE
jgi:hypothetical protein